MITRVYHITKFQDFSSYIFFRGCNWNCEFCIMKKYTFDIHWSKNQSQNLSIKFLTIDNVLKILLENNIKEVFLGGGEPTIDTALIPLLLELKNKNIKINILTNGELLNEKIVNLSDRISFSIKAINNEVHKMITHRSNKKSLENLMKYINEKFSIETVYVRKLGCKNVMEIASFLDSLKSNSLLRVDPLIPINNKFSIPSLKEVDDCIRFVSKNTNVIPYKIKGNGQSAEVLYP